MMDWKAIYDEKLVSVEEAARQIEPGDSIYSSHASSPPVTLLNALSDRMNELRDVTLISALELQNYNWLSSENASGKINYGTIFYEPYARANAAKHTTSINSVCFSQLRNAYEETWHMNCLVSSVSPPDEEGYVSWGTSGVCTAADVIDAIDARPASDKRPKKIIVQVNKRQPRVISGVRHKIHVSELTCICECDEDIPYIPKAPSTEIDKKIAQLLIPLIPDGCVLQLGFGGLGNAIGYGLDAKKDLSVHTEVFMDSMVGLMKKGVINGTVKVGFAFGDKEVAEFCHENDKLEFMPLSVCNNPMELAKNDNLVSINAAIMADLTGQVCAENIGHRQYSCTGGRWISSLRPGNQRAA